MLRRRVVERRAAEATTSLDGQSDQAELRSVIDEEIRRLPERYRVPLVLCHVEGLRHHEVAHRLGCPVGTVESRLSRAREQLRTRLARCGPAPTAPTLGIMLRPPGRSAITPALLETTLRAAGEVSHQQATVGTGIVSLWSSVKIMFGQIPTFKHAIVASTLVVSVGVAALGLTVYRAAGESPRPPVVDPPPAPTAPPQAGLASAKSRQDDIAPKRDVSATDWPLAKNAGKQANPIATTRFPSAVARPLTNITIDGRLDDWPKELTRYPINNQLVGHPSYNSAPLTPDEDPRAYFLAGYDPVAEQVYLAVVVHDNDIVVHPTDVLQTDSVEIYIDGNFSAKLVSAPPSLDWGDTLNAATMPVLQYAGVPGRVSAYGDRWNANPSLVYARTRQTSTTMKYRRDGDVTTYEWSVKAFDHFPDRPTPLYPGKRLGLEVAVLDKDRTRPKIKTTTTFLTWGLPPKAIQRLQCRQPGRADSLGQSIAVISFPARVHGP